MEGQQEQQNLPALMGLASMNYVDIANKLETAILDGEVEPLNVHFFLKKVEKITEQLKENKDVKAAILNSANRYINGAKTAKHLDGSIRIGQVGTNYDYSTCNDILWDNLNEIFHQVKAMKEARELLLKNAFPDGNVVKFGFTAPKVIVEYTYSLQQHDCNEEVALSAPLKRSQEQVIVTLSKK